MTECRGRRYRTESIPGTGMKRAESKSNTGDNTCNDTGEKPARKIFLKSLLACVGHLACSEIIVVLASYYIHLAGYSHTADFLMWPYKFVGQVAPLKQLDQRRPQR